MNNTKILKYFLSLKFFFQKYRKKCSVCGEGIEGKFFIKDDKIICSKDYKASNRVRVQIQSAESAFFGKVKFSDFFSYIILCLTYTNLA